MPTLHAPAAVIDRARAGFPAWHAARLKRVTEPAGNLALVETLWDARVEDHPGSVPIERRDLRTGAVHHGVRRFDADSPANRHFETIDVYPFDPDWVVEARFVPHDPPRLVAVRAPARQRRHPRPRRARRHPVHARRRRLRASTRSTTTARCCWSSATRPTASSTYGAGRFLIVPREPGDDRVVLDFNRAFVPPCGFSGQYNCPMPPRQNRFRLAVQAGEKLPRLPRRLPRSH